MSLAGLTRSAPVTRRSTFVSCVELAAGAAFRSACPDEHAPTRKLSAAASRTTFRAHTGAHGGAPGGLGGGTPERVLQIGDQVVGVLEADGHANQPLADAHGR